MCSCPIRWYTVVDEMSVDEISVDEMSVDELSWNRKYTILLKKYAESIAVLHDTIF